VQQNNQRDDCVRQMDDERHFRQYRMLLWYVNCI